MSTTQTSMHMQTRTHMQKHAQSHKRTRTLMQRSTHGHTIVHACSYTKEYAHLYKHERNQMNTHANTYSHAHIKKCKHAQSHAKTHPHSQPKAYTYMSYSIYKVFADDNCYSNLTISINEKVLNVNVSLRTLFSYVNRKICMSPLFPGKPMIA